MGVKMQVVIFELTPKEGCKDAYLDVAAELRVLLEEVEGFISVERFESLVRPGKILSLSFWRDAAAVKQWREVETHRGAQQNGRNNLFEDYRITVAEVERQYGMMDREQAPSG